jgi:hypothetical protein
MEKSVVLVTSEEKRKLVDAKASNKMSVADSLEEATAEESKKI